MLGNSPPSAIFNWKSQAVKKLGIADRQGKASEEELLDLMVKEPNLIKRPLIIVDGNLVAGFDKVAKPKLSKLLGTDLT